MRRCTAGKAPAGPDSALAMIDEALKCAFCFNLCERPVTVRRGTRGRASHALPPPTAQTPCLLSQAPCQHNFCLVCFTKWVQQSKTTCPTCRHAIPQAMRQNPRINSALVSAIRLVRRHCCSCSLSHAPLT